MNPTPSFREIAPGVRCSVRLIAALSEVAAEGYRRFPWGGVESGGLLAGRRDGNSVWLIDFTELNCEHEFGPAFHLSAKDMSGVATAIAGMAAGPLDVVGWFRTTSRDLELTGEDLKLTARFFPEPWQVVLIVHRGKLMEPRFGVFVKDAAAMALESRPAGDFTAASLEALPDAPPLGRDAQLLGAPALLQPAAPGSVRLPVAEESSANYRLRPSPPPPLQPAQPTAIAGEMEIVAPALPPELSAVDDGAFQEARDLSASSGSIATGGHRWLTFFGFTAHPFELLPDPAFYFEAGGHREAVAVLDYGIQARKGVMLLTGKAGLGKTALLESMERRLGERRIDVAAVWTPRVTVAELYESIAAALRLAPAGTSKVQRYIALQERAVQRIATGSTVVLVIDDAEELPLEVFEEIEILNNIENRRGKLIQIVLAGLPRLLEVLESPGLAGLKQRILLRAKLAGLTVPDTAEYIRFRLTKAGGSPHLFSGDLTEMIHRHTQGAPRLINAVCTAALELAFLQGERAPTAAIVEEAVARIER